jgi:hypothetical protein
VVEAIEPKAAAGIKALLDDQTKAMANAMGVSTEVAAKTIAAPPQQTLDLADSKYTWKPWRDVAPPHADVRPPAFRRPSSLQTFRPWPAARGRIPTAIPGSSTASLT